MERAVAQLLLERAPVVDVAGGEHDAAEAGVVEQVRGHRLHMAPAAVRVRDPPFGLERLADRAGGDGGEEGGERPRVVGMRALQQAGARRLAPARPEHGLDRAGQRADRAVALEDRDQVGRVLDDRLQARLALAGHPVQLERGVDPAAPLAGEHRQQRGEREHGGHPHGLVAADGRREHADRGEQRVDEVDPAEGLSSGRTSTPRPTRRRTAETAKSPRNCEASAASRTSAWTASGPGSPTVASNSAGGTQNHGSASARMARCGVLRPATIRGTRTSTCAAATSRGTSAGGSRSSIGSSTSCTGRVRPALTSNSIRRTAQHSPTSQVASAGSRAACGQQHGHGRRDDEEEHAEHGLGPQLAPGVRGRAPALVHQRGGEVVVPSAGRRGRAPEAAHTA